MFSEATGGAPRHVVLADVQPLRVLVDHRVDDVGEGLVGVEEAVPAREQVAFEPAEQGVLREHLHDAAVGRELAAVGVLRQHVGHPRLLGRLVDRLQAVGGGLVRPEHAEAGRVQLHHVAQELAEGLGVLVLHGAARGDLDRVLPEIGELQVLPQHPAVGVRIGAHAPRAARRQRLQLGPEPARRRRRAPPGCSCAASPPAASGWPDSRARPRTGPGATATSPRPCGP